MFLAAGLAVALLTAATPDLRPTLERILNRPEQLREMKLVELHLSESTVGLGIELPRRIPLDDLPPEFENAYETAVGAIAALRPEIERIDLRVGHPGEKLRPPPKRPPSRAPKPQFFVVPDPQRFPDGQALLGKTIAISPGHGYIYYDALGGYGTQRGRVSWGGCGDCRGIVEDFETHEIVIRHLIPLLEGAGARVVLVRERDYNAEGAISDDLGPGYSELAGTFTTGNSEGGHAGGYRASLDADASAEFTISAPVRGPQWLSSWFVAGNNRSSSLGLQLNGRFGTIDLYYDQKTHGRRWVPLALLDLDQGETVKVKLTAPAMGGEALIADAVRLGAGTHSSGHKLWEMGAQPYAAYQEAPSTVTSFGDVTIRPRYAEFYGADIYVALHSNASGQPNSTAAGLSTYRYNCGTFPDHSADPSPASCDDPPGSDRLQELIHSKMVERLRDEWDPAWVDRGPKVANFGELRELDGIPGILIESAFHDQEALSASSQLRMTDNQSLHDPRWRRSAGYAIYQGISEYFTPGGPLVLLPPRAVTAKNIAANKISVSFETIPGATRYRIYLARGGSRTFDGGILSETSPVEIDVAPNETILVKVAALNTAGEGPASNLVAARTAAKRSQVLFVDAFEREDAWIQDIDNLHDTVAVHALAAGDRDLAFDGTTEAAWSSGQVALTGYDGLVLAFGAESTEHEVLDETLRAQVLAFAQAGGAVFMSGSELGWTLDARGDAATRAFLVELFDASYGRDDSGVLSAEAAPGGWLAPALPAPAQLDDGSQGRLRARSSDVISLGMSSTAELYYAGGTDVAAVRKDKNIWMAFALDSLLDPAAQSAILGGFLDNAIPMIPIEPPTDGGVITPPDAGQPENDAGEPIPNDAGEIIPNDAGLISQPDAAINPTRPVFTPKATKAVSGGCACSDDLSARTGTINYLPLAALIYLLLRRRSAR